MWGVGDRGHRPRTSFLKRQGRFLLLTWLVLEALYLRLAARAEDDVPMARQYAALERGRDCRIYRDLAGRAKRDLVDNQRQLVALDESLRARRVALDQCGAANGIQEVLTESDDARLAEVCPTAYQAWLSPGYRREILKEDLRDANEAQSTLTGVLAACGGKI